MTAITLTTVVLNAATDPTDQLILSRMTKYDRRTTKAGRIEQVAGGGRRAIVAAGQSRSWTLAVSKADRTTCDWIETHIGSVVAVRDDAGNKMFAVYLDAPISEIADPRTVSFDLDLSEVTWTEAV